MLSDGNLAIDRPLFAGDAAGTDKLLDAAWPKGPIPTCVNEWVVNTGGKLVLVDAGAGTSFAPTLGNCTESRRRRRPAAVDVVITHITEKPHPRRHWRPASVICPEFGKVTYSTGRPN